MKYYSIHNDRDSQSVLAACATSRQTKMRMQTLTMVGDCAAGEVAPGAKFGSGCEAAAGATGQQRVQQAPFGLVPVGLQAVRHELLERVVRLPLRFLQYLPQRWLWHAGHAVLCVQRSSVRLGNALWQPCGPCGIQW